MANVLVAAGHFKQLTEMIEKEHFWRWHVGRFGSRRSAQRNSYRSPPRSRLLKLIYRDLRDGMKMFVESLDAESVGGDEILP